MKIIGNTVYAEGTNKLKTPFGLYCLFNLGKSIIIIDGKPIEVNVSLDEIEELKSIRVTDEEIYFVESKTYPELVTELIRKKYTLDDELALMANSRIGDDKYEMEFLNWRKLCKEAAKRVLNE